MTSWIQADDTLYLWMVVVLVTAIAITIEQKWKWGARISSCVMCIAGGMILANLKIIPFTSPVYDSIGNILLLLAIPLLLFKSDIRKIYKSSGTTFFDLQQLCSQCFSGILSAAFDFQKCRQYRKILCYVQCYSRRRYR